MPSNVVHKVQTARPYYFKKHLRTVRCSKCLRVFCCVKHRVEHERRVHVATPLIPSMMPVIKRRFRLTTPDSRPTTGGTVNGQKRRRAYAPDVPAKVSRFGGHALQPAAEETPARTILRARRCSMSSVKPLRPVAESSPAVPEPDTGPRTDVAGDDDDDRAACTPVGTAAAATASPPSFYQTPVLQMALWSLPDITSSDGDGGDKDDDGGTATEARGADTDAGTPPGPGVTTFIKPSGSSKRKSSPAHVSARKGFFWLNMARRFRSALLPAQNNNSAPSPATGAQDMARHYGNIHPRRPINMDAAALSVNARPSLEDIRMAHGRANGSTETDESDSDDYDE